MVKGNALTEVHEKRIARLFHMFSDFNVDIAGNPNYPMIVIDRVKLLHTYINNFDLYFLEKMSINGEIPPTIFQHKLRQGTKVSKSQLEEYVETYGFRRVYPIKLYGTDLFLSGWNFKDRHRGLLKYPVFARYRCHYFFSHEIVDSIIEDYPEYKLLKI